MLVVNRRDAALDLVENFTDDQSLDADASHHALRSYVGRENQLDPSRSFDARIHYSKGSKSGCDADLGAPATPRRLRVSVATLWSPALGVM